MDEPRDEPQSERSFSTPKMVGLMAGGILAVAFLVAIVRGGGAAGDSASAPAGGPESPGPARETGPLGPGELRLLAPLDAVPREGLTFRWEGGPDNAEYQVTIYDPTMKKLWSSARTAEKSVVPPESIVAYLRNGALYQWSVTGFRPGVEDARSKSHSFRIID